MAWDAFKPPSFVAGEATNMAVLSAHGVCFESVLLLIWSAFLLIGLLPPSPFYIPELLSPHLGLDVYCRDYHCHCLDFHLDLPYRPCYSGFLRLNLDTN